MNSSRVTVEAFACTVCARNHFLESNANACCACDECGTKFTRSGRGTCDRCSRKMQRKRVKGAIRSTEHALKQEEERHKDRVDYLKNSLMRLCAELETL